MTHGDVKRTARRGSVIGQHDSVRRRKDPFHLAVVHIAIQKGDAIAMPAALHQVFRNRPAFPGLAYDREPETRYVLVGYAVEGLDQVLEALERSNDTEKEKGAAGGRCGPYRPGEAAGARGRVLRRRWDQGAGRNDLHGSTRNAISLLQRGQIVF